VNQRKLNWRSWHVWESKLHTSYPIYPFWTFQYCDYGCILWWEIWMWRVNELEEVGGIVCWEYFLHGWWVLGFCDLLHYILIEFIDNSKKWGEKNPFLVDVMSGWTSNKIPKNSFFSDIKSKIFLHQNSLQHQQSHYSVSKSPSCNANQSIH